MLKSEDAVLKTVQDDDNFSQTQDDFYQRSYLHTNESYISSPISLKKISNHINENYEDRIYVKDIYDSLNYIGKPIINTQLYEFTCHENNEKYLARKDSLDNINKECYFLNKLEHKNILNWDRYIIDDSNTYILYENCGNLTLKEYLKQKKKLPEYEVRFIITELVNLLKYLKSKSVIHRNLQLSNILVTKKGRIKVMGFESAVVDNNLVEEHNLVDCLEYDFVKTPEMMQVDDLNQYKERFTFSYETDLWVVGSIVCNLLIGVFPLIDSKTNIYNYLKSIKNISSEAADCLKRLLEPDPKKRQKLNLIFLLPFF